MNERRVRKAYELVNKGWSADDILERLSISAAQLHAIKYAIGRQAQPYQLIHVLSDVLDGMSTPDIEWMVDMTLAGKPYNFNPLP